MVRYKRIDELKGNTAIQQGFAQVLNMLHEHVVSLTHSTETFQDSIGGDLVHLGSISDIEAVLENMLGDDYKMGEHTLDVLELYQNMIWFAVITNDAGGDLYYAHREHFAEAKGQAYFEQLG